MKPDYEHAGATVNVKDVTLVAECVCCIYGWLDGNPEARPLAQEIMRVRIDPSLSQGEILFVDDTGNVVEWDQLWFPGS